MSFLPTKWCKKYDTVFIIYLWEAGNGKGICLTYCISWPTEHSQGALPGGKKKPFSSPQQYTSYSGRASPGRIQLTSQCVWDDLIPEASFISIATHRKGQTLEERCPGLALRALHIMYNGSSQEGDYIGAYSTQRINPYMLSCVKGYLCIRRQKCVQFCFISAVWFHRRVEKLVCPWAHF